jgi:tetratricopeptide (TPR) repeat protein
LELLRDRRPEARAYLDRALAELVAAVGPDHPDVARIEGGLGSLARDEDRCADAIPHFERALAIAERVGRTGTNLAIDLTNLGACLADVGRDPEARPLLERALAEWTAAGAPPISRAETSAIYADIEWRAGHRDRAIELAKGVVAATEGAEGAFKEIREIMQRHLAEWSRR